MALQIDNNIKNDISIEKRKNIAHKGQQWGQLVRGVGIHFTSIIHHSTLKE